MSAEREDAAKIIYAGMQELMPLGKDYPWIEGGNSNAQDTARRTAAKLPLLTTAQAAVLKAAEDWDHYFFDPRSNKNRQMREDDLHYTLMTLRAQEGA